MKIQHAIAELESLTGPLYLAIGVFDGVHLGHRAVIERAVASARGNAGTAVVVTFDPHPATILRPDQAPALLSSTRHKLRLFARLGVAHTLVLPFDSGFAATAPSDFILQLVAAARPLRQICVGENWAFGKGRQGSLELLQTLGVKLGFEAVGIDSVEVDGEVVSSTAIRAAIQSADLEKAARMLGRRFSVFGRVWPGRQLARQLGFPTANVRPECEQLPPDGVYVVRVEVGTDERYGIANVGLRPTVEPSATERLVEVHVFDFDGNLTGEDLDVAFLEFLRPEKKFPSIDALRVQIGLDVGRAKELARRAQG